MDFKELNNMLSFYSCFFKDYFAVILSVQREGNFKHVVIYV
jgi:hypothetical protein